MSECPIDKQKYVYTVCFWTVIEENPQTREHANFAVKRQRCCNVTQSTFIVLFIHIHISTRVINALLCFVEAVGKAIHLYVSMVSTLMSPQKSDNIHL